MSSLASVAPRRRSAWPLCPSRPVSLALSLFVLLAACWPPVVLASAPAVNVYASTSSYTLYNPYGVCTDSAGNVYIGDYSSSANRVLKLSPSGALLQTFSGLSRPQGVAVDSTGNVYVANNGNSTVVKFNATGSIVAIYGGGNIGPDFIYPYSVVLDPHGYIYVSDTNNQTVVKLSQRYAQQAAVTAAAAAAAAVAAAAAAVASLPCLATGPPVSVAHLHLLSAWPVGCLCVCVCVCVCVRVCV